MTKSGVVDSATGKTKDSEVRTSEGTFFTKGQDEIITRIEKRVAQVTMVPVGEGGRAGRDGPEWARQGSSPWCPLMREGGRPARWCPSVSEGGQVGPGLGVCG